jgi:hypothetical protein
LNKEQRTLNIEQKSRQGRQFVRDENILQRQTSTINIRFNWKSSGKFLTLNLLRKAYYSHKITKAQKFTKYYYIEKQFFVEFCVVVF